jgi:hypothetical protein
MEDIENVKLLKFFRKCEKFFSDNYPSTTDSIGIPSLIEVFIEKKEYSLTHSIDRHHFLDIANKLSEMYVEEKFKKYKNYILSM